MHIFEDNLGCYFSKNMASHSHEDKEVNPKKGFSNASQFDIKDIEILHDLLAITESIVKGAAYITVDVVENLLYCKITTNSRHPTIIVFYENQKRDCTDELLNEKHSLFTFSEQIANERKKSEINICDNVLSKLTGIEGSVHYKSIMEKKKNTVHDFEKKLCNETSLFCLQNKDNSCGFKQASFQTTTSQDEMIIISLNKTINSKTESSNSELKLGSYLQPEQFLLHSDVKDKLYSCSKSNQVCHVNESAHMCGYCEESFSNKRAMKIHEKVHNMKRLSKHTSNNDSKSCISVKTLGGEKPHLCNFCGKTFTHIYRKHAHEQLHKGMNSLLNDIKTSCDVKNKQKNEKKQDAEKTKTYLCGFCNKAFSHSSDKERHERIHTGHKPYSCDYCKKTFAYLYRKHAHERVHKI